LALLADLEPLVIPECHGVPYPIAQSAIRDAVREFLLETGIWIDALQAINTEADVTEYALTKPADCEIVRLKSVSVGGRRCEATSEDALDDEHGDQWEQLTGPPIKYYTRDGGDHLSLFRIPVSVQEVKVRAALTISESATTYPDFLNTKHKQALAAGAKSKLQFMTGTPWENPSAALNNAAFFQKAKDSAATDVFHGMNGTARRVKARFI